MSVALVAAVAFVVSGGRAESAPDFEPAAEASSSLATVSSETGSEDSTETVAAVELPDLVGKTLAEATLLMQALGVTVDLVEDPEMAEAAHGDARIVQGQFPESGVLLRAGEAVQLVVGATGSSDSSGTPPRMVVVIDPGHQSQGDATPEPVGPGSSITKPRVTSGTSGVVTGLPEHEVVLQISMNLASRLEAAGVTVLLTRETSDVNVSNSERAAIANDAEAHLFVRVHADGSSDPARAGISTLYPGENEWTGAIAAPSRRAASLIHDAVVTATGAECLGTVARTDIAGFNWSRVPAVLVECGFMTNPVEDRLLSSPHYQDKLAEGMAAGIVAFLSE